MNFNLEAETELLGAILSNSNLMCDAISLEPKDFYKESHQIIFKNMKQMFENGLSIEVTSLANQLNKELASVGGITYLTELLSSSMTKDIKQYRAIIKEKSLIRDLYYNLKKVTKQVEDDKGLEEIVEFIQGKMFCTSIEKEESGDMQPVLFNFFDNLEKRYKNKGEIRKR